MSDIVYSVEVQYLQNGNFNAPAAGLDKLQSKTDQWVRSFDKVGSFFGSFNNTLDSMAGAVVGFGSQLASAIAQGATVGFALAAKAAFDFNEEIESTTISLAAIANANGLVDNMQGGMRIAADIVKEMRLDAARLPGEFKDLENIMATIANAGAQAGIGQFGMEKMAAKMMTASEILKIRQDVGARELAMLLEGNARHNMPLFNKLGLGMSAKEFNQLGGKERFGLIRSRLDALNGDPNDPGSAQNRFAASWKGLRTTAIDNIRQGIGFVGMPVFNSVKELVGRFNDFSKNSKDKLRGWGEYLGNGIDHAFHRGVDAVEHWYPIVRDFAKDMYGHLHDGWVRIEPIVERIFGRVEGFMKDPAAFDKLSGLVEKFIAIRAGGWGLEHGFGLGSSFLSSVGSSAGGGSAGLAAMSEAFPIVAAAAVALGVALYGVTSAVEDTTSAFHEVTTQAVKSLARDTAILGADLQKPGGAFTTVSQAMGYAAVTVVDTWTNTMDLVAKGANAFVDGLETNIDRLMNTHLRPTEGESNDHNFEYNPQVRFLNAQADKEKDRKIPQNVTHIHHVEIRVNPNGDPTRMAKKTAQVLLDLARHPKTASLTGATVMTR